MNQSSFPISSNPFILGIPEDLPVDEQGLQSAKMLASQVITQIEAAQAYRSLTTFISTLNSIHQQLPQISDGVAVDDPRESQENRDNDKAFWIERHRGESTALLIKATLEATVQVCELVERWGTNLSQDEWNQVISTVDAILHTIIEPRSMPRAWNASLALPARQEDPNMPFRRWVRGHLLFMVLCQGMSLSLNLMTRAAQNNDIELAHAQANRIIQLMDISRITLEFATDLNQEQYLSEIRPTLMPPIAPPKMSGINWRDHEVLVRLMRQSTPVWSFIEQTHPKTVERMRSVLTEVYTAHRSVCEKFVGESSSSLLARTKAATPAGQILEGLKKTRMRSLDTSALTPDEHKK
ncbi:hypothetical protein WDV76_00545 [Xenorhabdus griffiniae]|uniref:hypothetical protein n=1 Tax=Xenorhabdus griffiniae TaxID=351672 RepID=UPI00235A074F|nr:hypothetical protein [Xenorhabdus griffiniae]MDC9605257.1 hypothetical protein [Xenorhabdus griffiniae]